MNLRRHRPQTRYVLRTNRPPLFRYSQKRKLTTFLRRFGLPIVAALIVGGVLYTGWIYLTLPNPETIAQRTIAQSTKIYDRTGKVLLYEIHGDRRRTQVSLDDIPGYVKQATVVAEDRDFYSHQGFDVKGIVRALVMDVLRLGKVQGGSTITQQLVKNALLTSTKSINRKARELLLAYQIEQRFSKDQILKMYLNEIPYGKSAYGIEAAAQTYFAKSAKDLTLSESTLLATMVKAPSFYSPYGSHRDDLIANQHYLLDQMQGLHYITAAEAEAAKKQKLVFAAAREQITAPHFVFYVREILERTYGEKMVEEGGLTITTTLDATKQNIAQRAVDAGVKKYEQYQATNAALVSIDPKTGQILAMIGGQNYFDVEHDGNVNVTISKRQPGSSFKPIVYAAAFKKGYTPETVLVDAVTTFKNYPQDYTPHNYDLKEHGALTMRKALAGSLNIPAVKTLYLTGIPQVLELAKNLGYTTLDDPSRFGLSLVLGGGEVTLLEHTNAYAAFSQEGTWHKPSAILKVTDGDGVTLEQWRDESRNAINEEVARQLSSILSDNAARSYIFGANNKLVLADRPVAAKTGTTNDNRDAWTMGFTPSVATGVWVGNNDNAAMKRGSDGSIVAAPIWNTYMTEVTKGTPVQTFTLPSPTSSTLKPILRGVPGQERKAKIDRASGKLATSLTPASYVEEKTFVEHHTILHYVNRDDPNGPAPTNPQSDPQYQNWENAEQRWYAAQKIESGEVPIEEDSLHVPENIPTLSVSGITDQTTISSNALTLDITTQAPRGVRRLEIWLDKNILETTIDSPLPASLQRVVNLNTNGIVENGSHTLLVRVADDIDNTKELAYTFTLSR